MESEKKDMLSLSNLLSGGRVHSLDRQFILSNKAVLTLTIARSPPWLTRQALQKRDIFKNLLLIPTSFSAVFLMKIG